MENKKQRAKTKSGRSLEWESSCPACIYVTPKHQQRTEQREQTTHTRLKSRVTREFQAATKKYLRAASLLPLLPLRPQTRSPRNINSNNVVSAHHHACLSSLSARRRLRPLAQRTLRDAVRGHKWESVLCSFQFCAKFCVNNYAAERSWPQPHKSTKRGEWEVLNWEK